MESSSEDEHLMRFTRWLKDLWKQHRQDQQFLAPGQATEFPLYPLCGRVAIYSGSDMKETVMPSKSQNRNSFVSQNGDILCSHQAGHSALHLCCLSIQVTNSPAESFVSVQLFATLMLLLPSKSSMLLDHSEASPQLGPISLSKKNPNANPIMCVFATQLASPFQQWPLFPTPLILVLITLNCFWVS